MVSLWCNDLRTDDGKDWTDDIPGRRTTIDVSFDVPIPTRTTYFASDISLKFQIDGKQLHYSTKMKTSYWLSPSRGLVSPYPPSAATAHLRSRKFDIFPGSIAAFQPAI